MVRMNTKTTEICLLNVSGKVKEEILIEKVKKADNEQTLVHYGFMVGGVQ